MASTRTVRDLITRAASVATVIGAGDTLDGNDAADTLLSLNLMLDAWQAQNLYAYRIENITPFPLTAGIGTYTIGPTGDIVRPIRPVRIENGFTRDAFGYDRQLWPRSQQEYQAIVLKSLSGTFPSLMYYEPNFPDGTLYLWQLPQAGLTLHLGVWQMLSEYPNLDALVSLPPGYEDAIVYSLAERICIDFQKKVDPDLANQASNARATIKRNNIQPSRTTCEFRGRAQRDGLLPAWVFRGGLY